MKFIVLSSGSKGNATYLEIGNTKVLIDCGLSYRQIKLRLLERGKTLDDLSAVFITHEHSDHVNGLCNLAKKHDIKIYLSLGSFENLNKRILNDIDKSLFNIIKAEESLDFETFQVLPFLTYHDATEPFGYRFIYKNHSLVYITDTGYFPIKKYDIIRNAEAYIIESNHEVEMLLESARPWLLKRRILDDQGHLSNEDSANLMLNIIGDRTKYIVLAHLSEECNLEEHALKAYNKAFYAEGIDIDSYKIIIAKQNHSIEEISTE
jgi:phosphoribosyl 1,2-cyclic phosphodiesterase